MNGSALVKVRKAKAYRHPDQLPLITPDADWVAPEQADWIDFRDCKYLGLDTETHDPGLTEHGPGFIRGDAYLCGFSLADENGRKIYLPVGHAEGNVDKQKALEYLRYQLKRPGLVKVAANAMYELEVLWSEGLEIPGELRDVQIAEPLLDEDKATGYSLDVLANEYLGRRKNEQKLKEAGAAYGGDKANVKAMAAIMPAKYWGEYGEDDADLPVQIYLKQLERIKAEDLQSIFDLETRLQRVLFKMRLHGVAVDLDYAERLAKQTREEEDRLLKWLHREAHWDFNPFSGSDCHAVMLKRGFEGPYNKPTKKHPGGAPSITNEWLQEIGHVDPDTKQPSGSGDELAANLYELRRINKMRKDFLEGAILERNVCGRLHPQWHQLREYDEEGKRTRGTRSGRIAASKPNLTNVPARDPVWGRRVRGCFVADKGKRWFKFDYSQQEPRFLLHFAYLMDQLPRHLGGEPMPGAAEAVKRWCDDPTIDYHQMVADLIEERSGKPMKRRPAKDINLGGAYGMGFMKLFNKLKVHFPGLTTDMCKEILATYHEGVPYVKSMSNSCMRRVEEKGFIRTILGRRRRFNRWEKKSWGNKDDGYSWTYGSYEEAVAEWGAENVQRAGIHKALNALIQGSAGDQMKLTLCLLDDEGLTPQIQVYDELDGSWETPEEVRRIVHIMTHSVELVVPHLVEPEVGSSWGNLKDWVDG